VVTGYVHLLIAPVTRRFDFESDSIAYNAVLTQETASSTWTVDTITELAEGIQPQITPEELLEAEDIVRKDVSVPSMTVFDIVRGDGSSTSSRTTAHCQ
jgi:hypothetical protein